MFLFKYRKENHKDENKRRLINIIDVINLCHIVLIIYLFNVSGSGPVLLALALIMGVTYLLKKRLFDKLHVLNTNSRFKNFLVIVSKILLFLTWAYAVFVGVVTTLALYSSYYEEPIRKSDPNVYVNACRVNSESCYRLQAHYLPQACAPVEYGGRGQSGGQCYRDAYIEKIYFENGGYVAFDEQECVDKGNDRWLCTDKEAWDIEILEGLK